MLIGGRDFAAWGGPSPALRMAPGAVLCCHPHILLPGQSNFSVAGASTKFLDCIPYYHLNVTHHPRAQRRSL